MTANASDTPAIIVLLNDVLTAELTAINQYFLHAEILNHWGYRKLGAKVRVDSIDEMKHAEQIIERVLFLDGLPNVQRLGKINIGETVTEIFRADQALEREAIPRLNAGINLCVDHGDHGTRALLDTILASEEEHLDWIDTQLALIDKLGEANYLTQQLG